MPDEDRTEDTSTHLMRLSELNEVIEGLYKRNVELLRETECLGRKIDTLVDLREENDRLERILQAPLSVKDMQVAWENADDSTPVHVGDTIIQRDTGEDSFSVYVAHRDYPRPPLDIRVLHRAPQPEPWADLAATIRKAPSVYGTPDDLAKMLYERGVRVVGGDDDG